VRYVTKNSISTFSTRLGSIVPGRSVVSLSQCCSLSVRAPLRHLCRTERECLCFVMITRALCFYIHYVLLQARQAAGVPQRISCPVISAHHRFHTTILTSQPHLFTPTNINHHEGRIHSISVRVFFFAFGSSQPRPAIFGRLECIFAGSLEMKYIFYISVDCRHA
jgi:hypothetical protein